MKISRRDLDAAISALVESVENATDDNGNRLGLVFPEHLARQGILTTIRTKYPDVVVAFDDERSQVNSRMMRELDECP